MLYIEVIAGLFAGMGVFMYGMHIMSGGLERAAGKRMNAFIGKVTKNRFLSAGAGIASTAVIHSSTAVTVMVVGFVNSGAMNLYQAAGVIMGANIGTTVTGLIMALNSLNMSLYLMLPVFIGVVLIMCRGEKKNKAGIILAGFGLLFVGLDIMSNSMKGISGSVLKNLFDAIGNPVLLMLLGALAAAVTQSSTAVNGLIIAAVVPMGADGLDIADALYIILGTNVGTCITSMAASIGTGVNARRAALIHLLFNLFGTVLFGTVLMLFDKNQSGQFLNRIFGSNIKFQIAWFNFFQNLICAVIMLPLIRPLVFLTERLIRPAKHTEHAPYNKPA